MNLSIRPRISREDATVIHSDMHRLGIDPGELIRDMGRLGLRCDAGESLTFQRALLYAMKAIHEVKYPQLKARLFVPVNNEVDTGAESYAWHLYDTAGTAGIIHPSADDLPTVEASAAEQIQTIKSLGIGFGWDIQQLRAAAMGQVPLETRKAAAVRMGFERAVDKIAAQGEANASLPGMLGNANVPVITAGVTAGFTGAWTGGTTTPIQALADLNLIGNYVAANTTEAFAANALLLPIKQFQYISATPVNPGFQDKTILQTFLANQTYIKSVDSWSYLSTSGASSTTRAVAYNRSPTSLELIIPQEFEMLPPQPRNLKMFVPCHGRIGGVMIYEPLSMVYADGV